MPYARLETMAGTRKAPHIADATVRLEGPVVLTISASRWKVPTKPLGLSRGWSELGIT